MSVIGLRVGPFEIIEPATVPAPGDWYRARRTGMTRRQPTDVLVKMLSPDAEGPERASLQTEYDNLRAMEDPRVPVAVALYEGIGALAIDAPDGITLDDVLGARAAGSIAMTPPTLLDLALEIAETLQHAHHRNRHHGHLSGANIRLSTAGKVHIFGFAAGGRGETPARWRPPEVARGEAPTPSTDQWSLAAILAGLISGRAPWTGDDDSEPLNADVEPFVEPIERQWPALSRLFRRMLDPEPANRYPSMQPVRQELLALARKAGGTSEKRDLGKLMARRVGRTVAPDSDIPAEFTTDTAPPVPPPEDLTEATEATSAPPDEAAETEFLARPPVETAEEMEPPAPPDLAEPVEPAERPPPEAADEPPVAARVDEVPAPDVPLVDEPIDAVHPELDSDDVPEARRESDEPVGNDPDPPLDDALKADLEPSEPTVLLSPMAPIINLDADEDVDDEPTERYDQAKLRELDDLDDLSELDAPPPRAVAEADEEPSDVRADNERTQMYADLDSPVDGSFDAALDSAVDAAMDADMESSDVGLPPDELARALAVDSENESKDANFGEGPTAVPITDVSDAPDEPFYADPESMDHPIHDASKLSLETPVVTPAPVVRDEEPIEPAEAVRRQKFERPPASPVQRFAPLLVLVMVLLMLAMIAMAVM